MSNHEYPFWARWVIDNVNASDITSVDYIITAWNKTTNTFDTLTSGTISASDGSGRWVAPYTLPDNSDLDTFEGRFTPIGGSHPVLIDSLGLITKPAITVEPLGGCGTETHTSQVCDPDGNPLENVLVVASPYGTDYQFATAYTNVLGNYTISGLHIGHAYSISYNKDGFFGKTSEVVIA